MRVRILTDGEYRWGFTGVPGGDDLTGAQLRVEQCASCGDGALGFSDAWTPEFIWFPHSLTAGDYTLEIVLPLEFSGRVDVFFEG